MAPAAKNRRRPRFGQAAAADRRDRQPAESAAEAAPRRPRADLQASCPTTSATPPSAVLVERNSRLAMESVSELGPERGAQLLAGRSAEEIAKLVQEIPSDDAAALIDNLPDELSNEVLELMRRRESGQVESLLEYARADRRPHHEPERLRAQRRPDGRRGRSRRCRARATSRWCSISTSSTRAGIWSASRRCAGCCSCRPKRRSSGS